MSDCGICLSSADGDFIEMLHEDDSAVARKPHPCCECSAEIPAGATYQLHAGRFDGDHVEYRTCSVCAEIRTAFSCNGWVYSQLWDDLEAAFDDGINDSCFAKLRTVTAKAMLRARWLKWKGLAA